MDKILVLDFGGQYDQLIARRVREQHVYAKIVPYNKINIDEILKEDYKGIIFTGGPNSVYADNAPRYDKKILDLNIPILGICYGAQLLSYLSGGKVEKGEDSREYGKILFNHSGSVLFEDVPESSICWMSHSDYISEVPEGFIITAYRCMETCR